MVATTWQATATTRLMRITSPSPVQEGLGWPMNAVPVITASANSRAIRA